MVLAAGVTLALPPTAGADHQFALQWGSSGQLADPSGLDTDSFDNVYVADYSNHRIQKFSPDGELLRSWGGFGTDPGQFRNPKDVAVDSSGFVYVADELNHRIQKFNSQGGHVATFGGIASGTGDDQYDHPYSVAVDNAGFLYVADHNNDRIKRVTTAGVFNTSWGTSGSGDGQFGGPSGVAVNEASGRVYVTDYDNDRVQYFSSTGTYQGQWGAPGTGDTQFNGPIAVDTSSAGVFVVDEVNQRVTQFDADGVYTHKWPPGSGGQFNTPQGIAIGSLNRFFVSDLQNRIQRFDGPLTTSVVRTSGTRLIFEAVSGDVNDVDITRTSPTTFTATDDPGNSLVGGGGCAVSTGTALCTFPVGTTVSSIRVTTLDLADSVVITGATGAVVDGGGGDDEVTGGDGDDTLTGGDGGDTLTGGSGTDTASYAEVSGPVTVNLHAGSATGGDTLAGIENATGGSGADTFVSSAGPNAFNGGIGSDTVSYAQSASEVTVNLDAGTASGGDTLADIQNVTGSAQDDHLTGSGESNLIFGGAGSDVIHVNDSGADDVACGDGPDTVTADTADLVDRDCEVVTRVDGTPPGGGGGDGGGGGTGGGTGAGAAPGGAEPAPRPPVISGFVAPRMRSGKSGTFSYSLDKAASVIVTIERAQAGRKSGSVCKKQTRKNRKKRRCTMFVPVGKLTHAGAAGRNALRFSGKLAGRRLAAGIYRATAVATAASTKSIPATAKFAVLR